MSKLFFVLIFLVAIQAKCQEKNINETPISLETPIPVNNDIRIGVLDNGLRYYIRNNDLPKGKLELRLVLNVGSILEDENQLGLAHFMEHMCFNGTKNFEKNDLVAYLQSIGVQFGADLNAYTGFDRTVYILPIPSDDPEKLETGFQILEDWAHQTSLESDAIDSERGVVLEEYRIGLGANKRMLKDILPKMMYGSKYEKRLPIGTKKSIASFKHEDLRRFYKDWYRPDLMAVVAVGDVNVDEIEKKIKAHFGNIAKAEKPKERPHFSLANHKEVLVAISSDKEATVNYIQLMYKDREDSPKLLTVNDYRNNIIHSLFSIMINSRLNDLQNSPNPPFINARASYRQTFARARKAYTSNAFTSDNGQLSGLRALLIEQEKIKKYGFGKNEFERAKKRLQSRVETQYNERDKSESNQLVEEVIDHFLEHKPIPGIEWEYNVTNQLLPSIRIQEVSEKITSFIHDDNLVVILEGPEKEGTIIPSEDEVRKVLEKVKTISIEPHKDIAVENNLIKNIPKTGSIVAVTVNDKLNFKTMTLSNGAKVTYKKTDFKNDEILFDAYSPGGYSLYSDKDYFNSIFANAGFSQAGVGGFSLNDLNKILSDKNTRVGTSIRGISENLTGYTSPKNIETLFQLIYLNFTALNEDKVAFDIFLSRQKSLLPNLLSNPRIYFRMEVNKMRNGENPRFAGFPTVEKLDQINYKRAYERYTERFSNAADFHFYFVGNFDEDILKKMSAQYLAILPTKNRSEDYIADPFRPKDEKLKFIVEKGSEPQSSVSMSWIEEIDYDEKTDYAINALGEILTIKLVEKLREEKAGVYGVSARGSFSKIPYGNLNFSVSFPCDPKNVDQLVTASLNEIDQIKTNGVSDQDLQKIRETSLQNHKESVKTNRYWINGLTTLAIEDRSINFLLDYEKNIMALTSEDIQNAAQKFLDDHYFLSVLMPESSVE